MNRKLTKKQWIFVWIMAIVPIVLSVFLGELIITSLVVLAALSMNGMLWFAQREKFALMFVCMMMLLASVGSFMTTPAWLPV